MADDRDSAALKEAAQKEVEKQVGELKLSTEDVQKLMSRLPDVDLIMKEVTEKLRSMPSQDAVVAESSAEVGGLAVYVDDLPSFDVNDPDIEVEIINGKKHYRMRLEPFIELAQAEESRRADKESKVLVEEVMDTVLGSATPDESSANKPKEPHHKEEKPKFVDLVKDESRPKGNFPRPPIPGHSN